MKKFLKVFSVIIIGLSATAIAMSDYFVSGTWRYRITVEIETPEGIKSGSTVREVKAFARPGLPGEPSKNYVSYDVIGEAVVIDLGKPGILFYPLELYSNNIIEMSFPAKNKNPIERIRYYTKLKAGSQVSRKNWTSFIILIKKNNYKTLQRLDSKDFKEFFNDTVTLKQIIIEITDEPVEWTIAPFLNMINGEWGSYYRQLFQNK